MSTGTWRREKCVRRVEIIAGNSNGVWKRVRRRFSEILDADREDIYAVMVSVT